MQNIIITDSCQQNCVSEAVNNLLSEIITGRIRPNQQIIETDIAKRFGMSRTPVRDALKQLELLGAVTRLPNRRVVVSEQTPKRLIDFYEIREALETTAIKLACKRASERQITAIARANSRCNPVTQRKDPVKFFEANTDFHKQIVFASGNEELWPQLQRTFWFGWRIPYMFTAKDWRVVQKEHDRIMDALSHRDETRAANAVHRHIKTAIDFSLRYLAFPIK